VAVALRLESLERAHAAFSHRDLSRESSSTDTATFRLRDYVPHPLSEFPSISCKNNTASASGLLHHETVIRPD
ncbi:uncharacterized protein METZ01_LOCUS277552, partial [marine metagenome]